MKKILLLIVAISTASALTAYKASAQEEAADSKFETCVIKDFIDKHKDDIENCQFESLEVNGNLATSLKSCKLEAWTMLKDQSIGNSVSKLAAAAEIVTKLKSMQTDTINKINIEVQSAIEVCRKNGNLNYQEFKISISPKGSISIHKVAIE